MVNEILTKQRKIVTKSRFYFFPRAAIKKKQQKSVYFIRKSNSLYILVDSV